MRQLAGTGEEFEEIDERERTYWNRLFQLPLAQLEFTRRDYELDALGKCQLELLGPLAGKRVLELGCGDGVWAVRLALLGAEVYAVDVADEAVNLTRRRAKANQVEHKVHPVKMSAYALKFPDQHFDLVHGSSVLHHLDCRRVGPELRRVLKPGGRAIFLENSANNPLLMLARKLCGHLGIPRWSSDDEYPLRRRDIAALRPSFSALEIHYPMFLFFFYFDAKFFGYKNRPVNRVCNWLDDAVYRYLPFLRPYSYHQVLEFKA